MNRLSRIDIKKNTQKINTMKHDRRKFLKAFALHGKFAHAIVAAFA